MSVIIPFSSTSQFATGNPLQPTNANFPSLKHFWSCPQTDVGTTKLTDLIGTAHLVKSTGTIAAGPDNFSVLPSQVAGGVATISGTLVSPGTKNCLLFTVGKFSTSGFAIGNTGGASGGIYQGQGQAASLFDGTNTLAGTAFTNGSTTTYGRAISVNWSGNAVNFEATTTTTITQLTGVATSTATPGTIAGGIALLDPTWSCASIVTALYGAAWFVFAGALPPLSLIKSSVAWMTYQWSIGNKVISPDLKGVT